MTRARAIAAGALLALVVALVATAAPARERPAELGRMAAEGAVTLAAAGSSHAIITAGGLRPGQSVGGNVALANVGESRGRLTLLRTRMVDTPGRFGGRLSDALLLRVEEVGGGSWTGPLAGPDALDLGVMEPGEGRSYRLTLTLPDTGPAGRDNAVQGSSVTIDWAWATESLGGPARDPDRHAAAATPAPPGPPAAAARRPRHADRPSRRCRCAGRRSCTCASRASACSPRAGSRCTAAATARAGSPSGRGSETSPLARASGAHAAAPAACSASSAARGGCRARGRPSGGCACGSRRARSRTLKRTMHYKARVARRDRRPRARSRRDADRDPPDRAQAPAAHRRLGRRRRSASRGSARRR